MQPDLKFLQGMMWLQWRVQVFKGILPIVYASIFHFEVRKVHERTALLLIRMVFDLSEMGQMGLTLNPSVLQKLASIRLNANSHMLVESLHN